MNDNKKNNTGSENTGNNNSGNRNSGNRNSGDWNSGNWNSGNWNSGGCNSGSCNSGNRNSGYRNSGNWNSGDWNSGNWNSGFLNTDLPKLRIFNQETDIKREDICFPDYFYFDLTEWVVLEDMTEKEKKAHPDARTTDGYLKTLDYKEAWKKAYNNASEEDKKKTLELPNFDPEIFKKITGIDISDSCDGKVVEIDGKKYRLKEIEG